ncbi:Ig-like domain-containing protein [Actinomadura madurae]|uniref:Ig-like domain-containing protein n=1 Tax=Actinomadura madurae TaxID=1993 RepID=UPI0020D20256|nr:Ig-like domain-containing protein [Actinomadura madurae]MCP9971549.1 Ig-like domain-containing protein [Actinomadura madurae]MCP9984040.1 Ig-like domain-containing protein [Actinomadura madurae]
MAQDRATGDGAPPPCSSAPGLAAGAASCSGGGEPAAGEAVRLAVSPGGGGGKLRPDSPIAVEAARGTIQNVTVTAKGRPVEGDLNAERTRWRSRWTLEPGTAYTVDATALGKDGRTRTVRSAFSTARVKKTNRVTLEAPYNKETVGVGMPIIMRFDRKVKDRAAVERGLEVTADKTVEGAWHWFGDQEVVFRPKAYWRRTRRCRSGRTSAASAPAGTSTAERTTPSTSRSATRTFPRPARTATRWW